MPQSSFTIRLTIPDPEAHVIEASGSGEIYIYLDYEKQAAGSITLEEGECCFFLPRPFWEA
ncbi:hypothetical protein J7E81_01930 [Bacillus sp. ISL-18]|uniref:hypothetical protein n=1 Tax=Bacillus sp. ISL-18 TaxID=2819118 RepID=UPI001BE791F9|nr:hypothetical protein [Bacillus sp. ISL-18]MBT2654003.1 hypothetical protein [Bacillus sp. ISL-18]